MPLSEHEQHLLEQMEQALYAEDPKFASQMQGVTARARLRRRIVIGAVVVVLGLTLVVLSVINEAVLLGGLGFAVMVGGAAYVFTPPKAAKPTLGTVSGDGTVRATTPRAAAAPGQRKPAGKKAKTSGSFMRRMEQRWDRRRNDWQ